MVWHCFSQTNWKEKQSYKRSYYVAFQFPRGACLLSRNNNDQNKRLGVIGFSFDSDWLSLQRTHCLGWSRIPPPSGRNGGRDRHERRLRRTDTTQLLSTSNFIGPWYHVALLFSGLGSTVLLFVLLFSQQTREDLVRAAYRRVGRYHWLRANKPVSSFFSIEIMSQSGEGWRWRKINTLGAVRSIYSLPI